MTFDLKRRTIITVLLPCADAAGKKKITFFISPIQVPFLRRDEKVIKTFHPEEKKGDCLQVKAKLPRIQCGEKRKEICFPALELVEENLTLRNCRFNKRNEVCQDVKFDVPKTLCKNRPRPF